MSRRHPTLARGPGRPRKPRGGPCGYCGRPVPADARHALYCSDSHAALAGRERRRNDPAAQAARGERPPLTDYVRRLIARTGGSAP